jgi:hypothetical protein
MKASLGEFRKRNGRKIVVRIDKEDSWSVDSTLAVIILPTLIQLKQNSQGVPNEFGDVGGGDWENQESFDFYKETYNEAFDISCQKWNEILDKMIWSFQQVAFGDYDSKYHHGEAIFEWTKTKESGLNPLTGKVENFSEMVDKNPDEHWYDIVGHREHERRIQEGLELFGKYFRNLWD